MGTLKISISVSRAVLQGARDGLVMMGSWHQKLQPLAEHPPLQAGWSLGVCCFDTSVPLLSRLSSSKVCNVGVWGAAQPHNLPWLLPNLTS